MPSFPPRIRALAVGVGVFALVAVAAGGTFAASNPATLYACYDNYGNVRMGDTAQCKLPGGGRLVTWSTAGIPGPTGATGPQGPTGPTGATGAAGPSGVRAWAYIGADGSVLRGVNVPSATRPGFFYCVQPAPSIDPLTTAPIVTAATDLSSSTTPFGRIATALAGSSACPAGSILVVIVDPTGMPIPGSFSIVIP